MPLSYPQVRSVLRGGCAVFALCAPAFAQARSAPYTGHAVPGIHGLESSLRPRPGFSVDTYLLSYTATRESDRDGQPTNAPGRVRHLSNSTSVTWVSPWKIFGADYAASARFSLVSNAPNPRDISQGNNRKINFGDSYLEPLSLFWTGDSAVLNFRYGYWFDTGEFSKTSAENVGKGFGAHQFSLGLTHYLDSEQLWHYSVMTRYSMPESVRGIDLQPGDDLVVDWNVGKNIKERLNVGLAGYGVFQTNPESGAAARPGLGAYGTTSIGLISRYAIPQWGGHTYLRFFQEFNSYNRTEGSVVLFGLEFSL